MAHPNQIRAGILASTHQIAGSLDLPLGHRYRRDLTQAEQPGQMRGVTGIGLDPIPARPDQLRGRRHSAIDLRLAQRPR